MKTKTSTLRAAIAIAALLIAPNLMGAASSETNVQIGDTEQLSHSERQLLASDDLKRVVIDPASGDVTAVERMTQAELNSEMFGTGIRPFAATANGCTTTARPCWHGRPPAINYSFTVGTTNGTWDNRQNFWTANYYAKMCWRNSAPFGVFCMPERNGKNAWIELGYAVTGTQVNVSTTRV